MAFLVFPRVAAVFYSKFGLFLSMPFLVFPALLQFSTPNLACFSACLSWFFPRCCSFLLQIWLVSQHAFPGFSRVAAVFYSKFGLFLSMAFLVFPALLQFSTPNLACFSIMFCKVNTDTGTLHSWPPDRASHADDVVHQLRSIRLPLYSEAAAIQTGHAALLTLLWPMQSCCSSKIQSARDTSRGRSMQLQWPLVPNLVWPNPKSPLSSSRFWTFVAVGYSESVISLPSEVASGSLLRLLKFLPVFKFTGTLRSWLPSDAPQSVSSLRKIVIVAVH